MFSGIVRGVGRVLKSADLGADRRLTIDTRGVALPPLEVGCSIAVNGVCLTAVECTEGRFAADVSLQTLAATTLGELVRGDAVNLESALRLNDTVDGHLVTGHVDGIGRVVGVEAAGRSIGVRIAVEEELLRFVARKGAVAVDGVSLTVNAVDKGTFEVNIIPHTSDMTVASDYRPGRAVNIEVDIVARYLERLRAFDGTFDN